MSFGKNSPETSSASSSETKNTQISPTVTAGANSNVGGPVVLSDLSGVTAPIDISTTDQGAVNAGLQIALAGLDTANTSLDDITSVSKTSATEAGNENSDLASLAQTVAQGQDNASLKYLIIGVGILAAAAVAYAYFSKK